MQYRPVVVMGLAVALVACSGEAEITRLPAGGSAQAGAASRVPAVPRYPSGGGAGGVAGAATGGTSGAAGTTSEPLGAGGHEAGQGGVGGESTADLGLLDGNVFRYQITQQWQSDNIGEWPEDSEYVPADVDAEIWATFSGDATQLQLTESGVAEPVNGQRTSVAEDSVQYELDLFAGGHFAAWIDGPRLAAEYTIYGSGVPVISSTRGWLELVEP